MVQTALSFIMKGIYLASAVYLFLKPDEILHKKVQTKYQFMLFIAKTGQKRTKDKAFTDNLIFI